MPFKVSTCSGATAAVREGGLPGRSDKGLQEAAVRYHWRERRQRRLTAEHQARHQVGPDPYDESFQVHALKLALHEAVLYHHRHGSERLANILTIKPEAVHCERGPNGELLLPTKKHQYQRAGHGRVDTMRRVTKKQLTQSCCGIPVFCFFVVLLDLDLVIAEHGLEAGADGLVKLPLWQL
jgi:hypothetical protein